MIVKVAPSPVRSAQSPLPVDPVSVPVVPVSVPVLPPPSSDEHAVSPSANTPTSTNTSFLILPPSLVRQRIAATAVGARGVRGRAHG